MAALSVFPARRASAAMSSAAGVVAGGSLAGDIQFSAFGSRMMLDDAPDPVFQGALAWFDPAGDEGGPLVIALAEVASYGPGELENERILAGTVSVNGEGAYPFALQFLDNGEIGAAADTIRLVVGTASADLTGTPVPAAADAGFDYDVEADLVTGNIQIVTFA
jgi:hypothetical protein